MFRNMIDQLFGREPRSKNRTTRSLRIDRREAFLRAMEPPAVVQTWIGKVKQTLWQEQKRSRGFRTHLGPTLQLEALEERAMLAVVGGDPLITGITNTSSNHTSLAEGPGGRIYAHWAAADGDDNMRFASSDDDGASWTHITAADFNKNTVAAVFPNAVDDLDEAQDDVGSFQVDSSGNFHVAFGVDLNSANNALDREGLVYGFYDSTVPSWTFELLVNSTGTSPRVRDVDIELDSNERPHIVFTTTDTVTRLGYVFHDASDWTDLAGNAVDGTLDAYDNGNQGTLIDSGTTTIGGLDSPDLEFDSNGNAGLSYTKNKDIEYLFLDRGAATPAWTAPGSATIDANLELKFETSLVFDSSDNAVIAYATSLVNSSNSFNNGVVVIATNATGSFVTEQVDTLPGSRIAVSGNSGGAHLAINTHDQIAIALALDTGSSGPDEYRVYYKNSGGTWVHDVGDTDAGNNIASFFSFPSKPILRDDGDFIGTYHDGGFSSSRFVSVTHGIPTNWPGPPAPTGTTGGVSGTMNEILTINGTGDANTITISLFAPNKIRIVDTGGISPGPGATMISATEIEVCLDDITTVFINGGAGDDTLNIDVGGGTHPLAGLAVTYDGNTGDNDKLVFTAGVTPLITYENETDGTATDLGGTIIYKNLDPIIFSGTVADIQLDFVSADATETIKVTDIGSGDTRVDSLTAGELTDFTNPTGSLTINSGAGDDTIDIDSLFGPYPGSLTIDGQADGASGDTINVNTAVSFAAGKTLSLTAETINVNNTVGTGGDVTLNVSSATGSGSASGVISGPGALIKDGAGDFSLDATNTYTGSTTISDGTLSISSDGNLGTAPGSATAGHLVIDDGATLQVTNDITLADNRGIAVGPTSGSGAGTIELDGTGNTFTYAGVIDDNGGGAGGLTVTSPGVGTFELDGSSTYTGPTTISAGGQVTLRTSNLTDGGAASGVGASSNAASNLVFEGSDSAVLEYTGGATSTDRLFTIGTDPTDATRLKNEGSGLLEFTNTGSIAFAGTGNASLRLQGANDGSFAPLLGDRSGGTTELIKQDAGDWTVTGANTYTGRTQITGGTLIVDSIADGGVASNLGASSNAASNLSFGGASTLRYVGSGDSTDRLFLRNNGNPTIESSGSGALNFTNTASINVPLLGTLTLGGSNTDTNTFAPLLNHFAFAGNIAKTGSGTWALTNAGSTYQGTTTVTGGILDVAKLADGGANSSIGASPSAASNLSIDGGTLRYSGSGDSSDRLFTLGAGGGTIDASGTGALDLNGTGAVAFSGGGALTLTLAGTNTDANTLGLDLADPGGSLSLTKDDAGSFTLSGTNTYSGPTTITGGTLGLGDGTSNNNIASSSTIDVQSGATLDVTGLDSGRFDLASGQTLQGTGTVSGSLQALSGSEVSPGDSPGILNTGDFDLDAGADLNIEINGVDAGNTANDHDQVNVSGSVTLAGNLVLTQPSATFTPAEGDEFIIINNDDTDAVTGTFAGQPEGFEITSFLGGTLSAYITYVGGDGNDVAILVEDSSPSVTLPTNSQSDEYTLEVDGANLVLSDDNTGALLYNAPLVSISGQFVIDGEANQSDRLTVDLTGIDETTPLDVLFNGGTAGNDTLVLADGDGGTDAVNLQFNYTNVNDGDVDIDVDGDLTFETTIAYTGLEPITSTITATNVTLNYSGATETITISEAAGDTTVNSTAGEITTFTNPTGTLTINGGSGNDTFNINSVASALIIDGQADTDTIVGSSAGDEFTVTGATNAGTGLVTTGDDALTFSNIENLTGGSAADTFTFDASLTGAAKGGGDNDTFNVNVNVGGTIDGEAGSNDVLDLSGHGTAQTVNLDNESATGLNGGAANGFDNIEDFIGDNVNDTLQGGGGSTTFTVSSENDGTVSVGATANFTDFPFLQGGVSGNTFTLNASLTGSAKGGGGNDTFNINSITSALTVDGEAGTDTIVGSNDGDSFTVTGATNAGTGLVTTGDDALTFSNIENLTGGSAADTFTFNASLTGTAKGGGDNDTFNVNVNVGGTIDGEAGSNDVLDLSGHGTAQTVNLDNNSATALFSGAANGFAGIEDFTGDNVNDTLQGGGGSTTFTVSSENDGTVSVGATANFTDFPFLQGGGSGNTFTLNASLTGSAKGGGGNDTFNINNIASALTIDGEAGNDSIVGSTSGDTFTVTGLANGGTGTVDGDGLTFSSIESIDGSGGNDTFNFDASLSGTATGGVGDDSFNVNVDVAGTIDGGSGAETFGDLLNVSLHITDQTVDLGNNSAPALNSGLVNGFVGIEDFVGDDLNDTLLGTGNADIFSLSTVNDGTVTGVVIAEFTNFSILDGSGGNDTFNFNASLTGSAAGGTGSDTFNINSITSALTIDGEADTDTIVGSDDGDSFTVTGAANAGTGLVTTGDDALTFSSIENLTGGSSGDAFTFNASLTGIAKGGAGDDSFAFGAGGSVDTSIDGEAGTGDLLDYSALSTAVTVNLVTGSATAVNSGATSSISGIEDATGGSAGDNLTGDTNDNTLTGGGGNDSITDGAGNDTLTGDGDDDTFVLTPGSDDVINDSGGNDTADFSGASGNITIDMDSTVVQTVEGANTVQLTGQIENYIGNNGDNTVSVDALAGAPRSVTAGSGTSDTLNVDAGGATYTDNGTSISFSGGLGTITYGTTWETISITGGGVVITGTALDDELEITATGSGSGSYVLTSGGVAGPTVTFSGVSSLTFNAGLGDDELVIDNTTALFQPTGGIFYNGEGQTTNPNGDTLTITAGTVTDIDFNYTNLNDGTIEYDNTTVLTYTGLEPITSTINATNVTLNYSTATETITVTDSAGDTNVNSTAGETTTFTNPSGTLTINAGDTGDDTVDIDSLPASYPANIVIDGEGPTGTDTVNINGTVTLGAGESLTVTADTIRLPNATSDVSTSGAGTVMLTAAQEIRLLADSSITSATGAITLNANLQATATTGSFIATRVVDADVSSTSGPITISGRGGDAAASGGVLINNGSTIATSGAIDIDGTVQGGDTLGIGVLIRDAGTRIDGSAGNITIDGTAAGTLNANVGVLMRVGAVVASSGAGTVTIQGTGAAGTFNNAGIGMFDADTAVTSSGGAVVLRGFAGNGSGDGNSGVVIGLDAAVSTTGAAAITIEGTGGNTGTSNNEGISIEGLVTSANGNIVLDGTGGASGNGIDLAAGGMVTATGAANITLLGDGPDATAVTGADVLVDGTITSASGTVTLTAEDDLDFGATGSIASTSGLVTVTADNAVGNLGGVIDMTDGSDIDAGSGAIDLNADGDITLSLLTTTGDVTVDSTSGSILDADAGTGNDIDAATAILNGATGVGTGANPLATTIDNLEADGGSSGVWLVNTGDLTIGGISGQEGVTGSGNVSVLAQSALTVGEEVSSTGGGDITLAAEGTADSDDLVVNADVSATGGNGNINLYAGDDVDLGMATVIVGTAGSGDILVSASTDFAGGSPVNGSVAGDGDVFMTSGSTIAAGGDATLRGKGNVDLSLVIGDSVVVTADFDGVGGGLSDGDGEITDNRTGESSNVTASVGVAFRAASGIGDASVDDGDIDIAVSSVAATTATGDISIFDSGDLTITTVDSLVGASITTGGAGDDILIRVGGTGDSDLVILQDVSNAGAGDITLAAIGDSAFDDLSVEATVQSTGGGDLLLISHDDLFPTASAAISTTGSGTIELAAGRDYVFGGAPALGDASGSIDMTSGATVTSAGGDITLGATSSVDLASVNAGSGTVIVNADTNSTGAGNITESLASEAANVTASEAVFRAATGIGGSDDIDTTISTLAASNSTSGSIAIANDGELSIGTVDGLAGVTNSGGGTVSVSTASPLTVDEDVTAVGSITLTALDDATDTLASEEDNLTVSTGVKIESTGADITLQAGDDLTVDTGSIVRAAGKVTIEGDFGDADTAGSVIDVLGEIDTVIQGEILGEADIDSILLDPDPGSSGGILIDGQGGIDDYTVQLGNLGGTVEVDDQTGEGTDDLTINDASGVAETFTVTPTSVTTTTGSETVTYTSELEFLTVRTLDGGDTINITPSMDTEIDIFGGTPTSTDPTPHDTLNFTTPGGSTTTLTNQTADSGTIETSGGFEDVNYDEIEDLTFAGALIVEGTADDDVLEITATGADSGSFVLTTTPPGTPGPTITFSGNTSFTFNGGDGSDELIINHPAGSAFAPTGGITYAGEGDTGDSDSLTIVGGVAATVTHTFTNDGTSDDNQGTIDWSGTTLTYTGLEPIFDGMIAVTKVRDDPVVTSVSVHVAVAGQ